MNDGLLFLIIIIFFVSDIFVILIVFWFISRMMGRLVASSEFPLISETWPAQGKPSGQCFNRLYIALNNTWYKNSANLIIADEGLHISFGFPVSWYVPQAALIPWKYIRYQKKSRACWTDTVEYQVLLESPVTLTVFSRVARSFPEHLKPE
jgi:hypothetical protein